ncbi:MAG: TolC family protein [Deltaproteobacteria bacterium]|nr:MAG: TolC family protein [Deltaproteobacteria bacterium]
MKRFMAYYLMQYILFPFLAVAVSIQGSYADAQEKSQGMLELPGLISEALERNPDIIAARNRLRSAEEIIQVRRSLPDPHVSYTYFVENVETRVGPQRHILGAKQTFPFYGKRDLQADIAAQDAEYLKQAYEGTKSEVIRQVKRSFYHLFYLTTVIDITHRERELLKRFENIARVKYETGRGLQQNILKVQVEMSKLDDRLLDLERQKQTAEAMLNTLLNRPTTGPLGKPIQPELPEVSVRQQELLELAKKNNPEVSAAQALIKKSESAYKLAKKDYAPDLTVGVNYIEVDEGPLNVSDNGKDAFNVMFSINLPIWQRKLSSQAHSALKTIAAQRGHSQNVSNRTSFEVKDNLFKIQSARETIDLYKSALIPQAGQSMESAEAGYVAGIVSFLDLLDAERVLLNIQFGYWRAYTDYLKHFTDLERAVGIQLTKLPSG